MSELVFFLEERSAAEMLKGLLPRLLQGTSTTPRYIAFRGKDDLKKRLKRRLRDWRTQGTYFVVLCDRDSADCKKLKNQLYTICQSAGKPDTLVRIVCCELESWYLGDLAAVATAIGPGNLGNRQNKEKYRNPDDLVKPSKELETIAPKYQKIAGSRVIGQHLSIQNNRSHSFRVFINGLQNLLTHPPHC